MNEFDDVIRVAREELEPSRADRERVKRRLLARAAGAGLIATVATKASMGAPGLGTLLGGQSLGALSKLFFGSMLVTLAGASVVVAVTRGFSGSPNRSAPADTPARTEPVHREAARIGAPSAEPARGGETATSAPDEAPALARGSRASTPTALGTSVTPVGRANAETPPLGSQLEAELALLREARLASAAGDVERARHALERLDLGHPRGLLLEERSALRAITECGTAGGAEQADDFLSRYPSSVYAAKVRRGCRVGLELASEPSPSKSFTGPAGTGH